MSDGARYSVEREQELLAACRESYVRGRALRMGNLYTASGDHRAEPYTAADLEHDVDRVLRGEMPERCSNWPVFGEGGSEYVET